VTLLTQQLHQHIILRIAVSEVLPEAFSVGKSARFSLCGRPFLHRFDEVIDAVMLAQPSALAFVTFQHPPFVRND